MRHDRHRQRLPGVFGRIVVDVRSVEVSFNIRAETFNALPIERTYRGLFQLIPGVAENRSQEDRVSVIVRYAPWWLNLDPLRPGTADRADIVEANQGRESAVPGVPRDIFDRLPADVVQQVAAVEGVADAQAFVQGDAVVIDRQGKPIERPTAPTS